MGLVGASLVSIVIFYITSLIIFCTLTGLIEKYILRRKAGTASLLATSKGGIHIHSRGRCLQYQNLNPQN